MPGAEGGGRSILFICDFNAHGGTQTHLLHLFASLDRRRFAPSLATLNLHPTLAGRIRELDLPVTNLELKGALRASTLTQAVSLAVRARRERLDLLHGCLFQGNVLTAIVSRMSGVPCVTSVRNAERAGSWRRRAAGAAAHRRAMRVIFNSRRVRDEAVAKDRIPAGKTVVIDNGVADVRREGAAGSVGSEILDGGRPTVVCVASLRLKKGHAHLLEAFRQTRARHPEARLLLVGEGPLRAQLEATARLLGLGESVVFTGYRSDIAVVLARSDLFVLSSLEEGMPNALLEAMSAGLPAVATDVGGVGEVVEDGITGYLVPPGQPAALADRLSSLLADPDLRKRQSAAARRLYEARFTVARMTAAYESLYASVLGG